MPFEDSCRRRGNAVNESPHRRIDKSKGFGVRDGVDRRLKGQQITFEDRKQMAATAPGKNGDEVGTESRQRRLGKRNSVPTVDKPASVQSRTEIAVRRSSVLGESNKFEC